VPTSTADGPFPQRDLIIFLSFVVILVTLVLQGLSLPSVIRWTGVCDGGEQHDEETRARLTAAKAALERIDAVAEEDWTREDTIARMRGMYEFRKQRLAARAGAIEDDGYEDRSQAYQQFVRSVLAAQRDALLALRHDGSLSNETWTRLQRELDLEESRLEG